MTPAFISKNREKRSKKRKIGHFAECLSQYTRQSGLPQDSTTVLCQVLKPWHSAKFQTFAECQDPALGKAATWRHSGPALCRVPDADTRQSAGPEWRHVAALLSAKALGKVFAECPKSDTRQRSLCRGRLCRVAFAECNTRQRVCRVQTGLCQV